MTIDFYAVRGAYIDAALFTDSIGEDFAADWARKTGEDDFAADVSLESFGFMRSDLDSSAMANANETVRSFLTTADRDALAYWAGELGDAQIGHDLWLTRNGHGAGFWDRFSADPGARFGELLTSHARAYGESFAYADADTERVYLDA